MKLNINDEQGIELLHFIFERELKPPFSESGGSRYYRYYNRDGECIGWLDSEEDFSVINPFLSNIKDKVCQVFGFPRDTGYWWDAIEPHLKSWMESQLNIKLKSVF